jgi:hypothetical protein
MFKEIKNCGFTPAVPQTELEERGADRAVERGAGQPWGSSWSPGGGAGAPGGAIVGLVRARWRLGETERDRQREEWFCSRRE